MAHLKRIEDAADALFIARFAPETWEAADDAPTRMAHGGWVLVAREGERESEPVGFVHVLEVDPSTAHIEALAVHPASQRRRVGRALVAAALQDARQRGYARVTLRTYADVPWNAPFYAACGFAEVHEGGFYAGCADKEARMGLMAYGRRITMAQSIVN
jgi:GNAT superfamily N-acetyltransferase